MNEIAVVRPRKLALPEAYRPMVKMAPVLANSGYSLRYTLELDNGLNILVDTFEDNRIEFRAMPNKEMRYIRMHKSVDINNPDSYVCKVKNPKEFLRAVLRFTQLPQKKVEQLDRAVGLKVEDSRLAFLRPFLATEPTYCDGKTTYMFEFPNGYTPIVKSHEDGTFDLSVQVDDGRGPVDLFDLGMSLWKKRGMKKLIALDNEFTMINLYKIFNLPKVEVKSTIFDDMTKEYWDVLDRKLDKGETITHTDFAGYVKERVDSNIHDMLRG